MALQIRPEYPNLLIVDGLDPTGDYRPALRDAIYGDPDSPVHRGSHTLWAAYPHPAQPDTDQNSPNFGYLDAETSPRPLRGIGDMRAIPTSTGAGDMAQALYLVLHESAHGWLVPADLVLTLPTGRETVLGSEPMTDDIFQGLPYGGPALLGRSDQHWGVYFQADASFMDGIGWDVAADVHDTMRWTQRTPQIPIAPAGLPTVELGNRYCDLDLFIIGLKRADDCYVNTGGRLSWLYPILTAGAPMQYHSGPFVALADGSFAYFGFYADHRVLGATHPASGWTTGPIDIGLGYDPLGGATMMLRIVYDGTELLFQAAIGDELAGVGPSAFAGATTAATLPTSGDFDTWQTVGRLPAPAAPSAVGLMTKTWNPVLVETQFRSFQVWPFSVPGLAAEVYDMNTVPTSWPGGPLTAVSPGQLHSEVPVELPRIAEIRPTAPARGLIVTAPWDTTYDHSAAVNHAPKVFAAAPDGPFAFGTTASVVRSAIGPAAAGGAAGTIMWGTQTSAPINGVVIPPRLTPTRNDTQPWRVAFVVAAADAAAVTDDDLNRLETVRRYYEAAAPIVSDGSLSVRADLGWQGWPPVLGGTFDQRTQIAAVTVRTGWIDLFAIGQDGQVYTAWFHDAPWQGWDPLPGGQFSRGTPVSAVSVYPGWIDVFAVGLDGRVYVDSLHGANWSGWNPIPGQNFPQGTAVTVVSSAQYAAEVFVLGTDGAVKTASRTPDLTWTVWTNVRDGLFDQGTAISAVSSEYGWVDLFAVGRDNRVYSAWRHGTSDWQEWTPILHGRFAQGTAVAAVPAHPSWIDLFAVGEDGAVYTAWLHGPPGWQGWNPVLVSSFDQRTSISAISVREDQIDLFAVGQDGRVWTAWFAPAWYGPPSPQWQGWSPILHDAFTARTPVAVVSSRSGQIDLFAVSQNGDRIETAWFLADQ